MIEKLGVILAGGSSVRWNGYPKEMLPIANGETLLDRSVESMKLAGVDNNVLVTSEEKIILHAKWLGDSVDYKVCKAENIWKPITAAFSYKAEKYLFAMSDTYFPLTIFNGLQDDDFNIGYFETDKPERFGVIDDHEIHDKQSYGVGIYQAWGVLSWSRRVVDFWKLNKDITTHTQAFNMAIDRFGYSMTKMSYYYDMATFDDYKEFIRGI